ncbi:hypothetical protein L873DRAFT_1790829 [Choiromyces venosus 120613-1]|uniref:Uncharacterized protein n=1 Tax=Choiromyces venosus 120613-1 TaxID=1336337 RepID=A0A3N4JK69_9PEZI|nr:hypothetical protein L873DRAFT_1790829 [Choiromyces venosus 120613-1]
MSSGKLPNQVVLQEGQLRTQKAELSTFYLQSLPPSSPPLQPREHEEIFSFRSPSPHPELSPPSQDAHSRSWSRSSSNLTASSPQGPSRQQRRGSSLYYTPAGSHGSSSSQQPPLIDNSGESPVLRPRIPLSRRGADSASISSGIHSGPSPTQRRAVLAQAHYSIQSRYTEDWVHHLGYQQHRRGDSSSCCVDSEADSNEDSNDFGAHRRNPSNAKTITPADFQVERNLRVPEGGDTESSDNDIGTAGGRAYRTAPQSLVDFRIDTPPPPMPALPSKWAIEVEGETVRNGEVDKLILAFPLTPGAEDNSMLRTPSSSTTATSGIATATYDKSLPISRTQSPNPRLTKRWNGKTVVIQIPSDTPWGVEGGRPMPLTRKEVENKMKEWESKGYDLQLAGGQCRDVFPSETQGKFEGCDVIVSIPDRRDWQAYVEALREEKLRALGVLLDDEPSSAVSGGRGQTPLSHQSPAQYNANNPFSPPAPTTSAMSGANGNISHFSPSMMAASVTPGYSPAHMPSPMGVSASMHNPHLSFHMPRQSMSMSNSPMEHSEWGPPSYSMFPPPPPQSQPTPPVLNGSGVWSPPFGMRGGSPIVQGLYSYPPSYSQSSNGGMYGTGYPLEANNDYMYTPEAEVNQRMHHHNHHHSIVGMERYHQQQIRRGSPLAQVGHPVPEEEDNQIAMLDGPILDAPVPKHRHQISVSLQKELEGVENYQRQNGHQHHHRHQGEAEPNPEGFNTNPVSPAPAMTYPEQPDIPHVEHDVHNGPELRSNPDDDVSDEETEKVRNKKAALARDRELQTGIKRHTYEDNTASLPMPEAQVPESQSYSPQEYPLPHSRGNSLNQMQHDYDINDPRQNSALAIIMSGIPGPRRSEPNMFSPLYPGNETLSEDGRTNLSEVLTNPSVPTSPIRKFSNPTTTTSHTNTHTHQISSNSNAWMSDNARPSASVTSSTTKFNAEAKEFKFEPGAPSLTLSPKTQALVPDSVTPSPISTHPRNHSRNQSASAFGGSASFGASNFNAAAATFRPSLLPGYHTGLFEKGAAAFSPNAPAFTPSSLAKPLPASQPSSTPSALPPIFSPVTEDATTVKTASVVRPPSRLNVHQVAEAAAEEANGDRRDVPAADEGGRKRAKHGPALSVVKDTEVPSLESLTPTRDTVAELDAASDMTAVVESGGETEGEKLIKEVPIVSIVNGADIEGSSLQPFEFKNSEDATGFAIADSGWDGPSRRESRIDILTAGDQLSIEEAQIIAADTPQDALSERNPTPPIQQVATPPTKKFNPNAAPSSLKPTAQAFNFEFTPGPKPPSPLSKKLGGMGESRYAHTPSPPPSNPPPPPPVTHNMPAFTPPIDDSPYHPNSDLYKTNAFGELIARPMPPDAELDEVIQHLMVSDPTFADQDAQEPITSDEDATPEESEHRTLSPWKRGSPGRMGIPAFDEQTPQHIFNHLDRSAGPSPSPRRAAAVPPYIPHRASSFSPDETYGRAHTTGEPAYQPPPPEIGVAKEPDSDWDDMISASEDAKLRPQSRLFFDAHVEELVGGLLRASLEPMNKSISSIHDVLKTYSALYPGRRGSAISTAAHSDADDEDDDDGPQPPRSPRKDRKGEIRAAVVEALTMHNWSASTEDKLSEIYGAIAKISRAFQDSNLNDDLAETRASILEALLKTAQSEEVAIVKNVITSSANTVTKSAAELVEFKATFINSFSQLAQVDDVNGVRDSLAGDLVDIKLGLQEILVQKDDVSELNGSVAKMGQEIARREDLEHFQNIAIDVFSKVVKSNDLLEVKALLGDIQKAIAGMNFASEVQKLCLDNTALRSMLGDVMKMTQDSAENIDFHQESQESVIRDNYEALQEKFGTVHQSISGIAKLIEERSLTNGPQSVPLPDSDVAFIKSVVEKIDRDVQLSSERQLGLDDFRQVIEKISVSQPRLEQIKEVVSDAVADVSELGEIRSIVEEVFETQPKMEDLRQMMEELFMKHKTEEVAKKVSDVNVEEMQWNMTRLERMLAETQKRADEEAQLRRDSREKAVELEARLRIAEEECVKQRELVEEKDRRLKAIDEKRHQTLTQTQMRSALLEGAHSSLQKSVTDLSAKNISLEVGLKEAQQTSERLREDNNRCEEENRELRKVIDTMRTEMEESIRIREKNRGKFDKLQEGITTAAQEIGKEQEQWKNTSEQQKARIEVLEARLESELTVKESLEGEVRRLGLEQQEAIKMKVELEQVKKASGRMEEMVENLKKEASERERQVEEMEEIIQEDKSSIALQEAEKAESIALLEQQSEYERQLDMIKSKYEDESHQLQRALGNANEDIQRTKDFMKERLNIASSESEILREHISHLKEQVKVATSAAQAAAQAATSVKLLATPATHNASEERALRESVEVLQSQLQQREARIEALEQELSKFDKADMKRKDEQITWLRELLEVRIDELEEIVHALSLPNFERERDNIRDTALRLKTNLQMEQQEKERAERKETSPAPNTLAARLPSVATSAWASWRGKGTGTPSQTSSIPSRPTSAAGFLGMLSTPSASAALSNARGLGSRTTGSPYTSDTSHQSLPVHSFRQREKQPAGRRLPPHIFNKTSYDDDAESSTILSPGRAPPIEETDDDDATERGDDDRDSEMEGYYNRQ